MTIYCTNANLSFNIDPNTKLCYQSTLARGYLIPAWPMVYTLSVKLSQINSTKIASPAFDLFVFLAQATWGTWSSWGACSASCGGGSSLRTRTCSNPSPSTGKSDCPGPNFEYATCNNQSCPIGG